MKISAQVDNSQGQHHVTLITNDKSHSIDISPKSTGFGSSANGGELLFLALATCYCNDIYREAGKRNLAIERVEVEVTGEFGAEGEPTQSVTYRARVHSPGNDNDKDILELMDYTDTVAEIQNTLRAGASVKLTNIEVINT